MKDEYITIKKQLLNKWFMLLNMSGKNTKQAVAREINDLLEDNNKVNYGQLEAKINDKNELEI